MSAQDGTPTRLETRLELTAILGGRELGAIDPELVADHLLTAYPHDEWPVLREAAHAVLRRAESVEREGLRVATRPGGKRWRGCYRTRRSRQAARPYETRLDGLRPLRLSCNCPDYQLASLGLCKHGLAVLADLAARRKRVGRADTGKTAPRVFWDPIRPLDGVGDWLEGVRLREDSVPKAIRRQLLPAEPGWLRIATDRVGANRRDLLAALAAALGEDPDPALASLLAHDAAELERVEALRCTPTALKRALASFRLALYPYQRHALERFLASGRLLLADDMGLGKTVQATAIAHVLQHVGKLHRGLVLAPASLKSQWVREWRRATDLPIEPVEGSADDRRRRYESTTQGVLVANYEQLFRDLDLVQAWAPELVVLDEAQRIKNWATQTAQRVKQLDVPYRLVLTGTPMENRLQELASIMDWVDPFAIAPKWRLGAAHDVVVDGAREVVGVKRLDVLRARLEPRMLRRRRSEILSDLPARTDTTRTVEMTPAQTEEHQALDQPIAKILRIARKRPLTQPEFLRLMSLLTTQRVIANGIGQLEFASIWPGLRGRRPDEAARATLSMPKLEHLRELVESIVVDQGRKMVVFSQWRRALTLSSWVVSDLLASAGVRAAFFTGEESQRRRTQNVVDFHDDPALRILFCTDAGGVGLNLQRAASCCVNFELPWNPAVLEQRVARLHRLGQTDPVDVYALVSEPSIEARIAMAVAAKRKLFVGLFDGETDEIRFEGSRSFLATVEAVVDPLPATANDSDPDAPDPVEAEKVEAAVTSADEHADADRSPSLPRLPDADEVRELFAELRVEARPDGGLHLEASPAAARTLGALFAGMAAMLERASTS